MWFWLRGTDNPIYTLGEGYCQSQGTDFSVNHWSTFLSMARCKIQAHKNFFLKYVYIYIYMYNYLKAFFASFPSVQSTPSCSLCWIVTAVANDLILIEPDSKKYFMLTQLIFCKRPLPKPDKVAHLRFLSGPNYYIPQRDGTPQQSSHDSVLDCVGTEKLK